MALPHCARVARAMTAAPHAAYSADVITANAREPHGRLYHS